MKIETKYGIGDEVWFGSLGFEKSARIGDRNFKRDRKIDFKFI